jgi:ribosomal protein S18 acetylase RimI-like enzyme
VPEFQDISFIPTTETDYEEFKLLRQSVMREHVERQGLPWRQWREDEFHKELFDKPGLQVILYKGERIGFVGVREEAGNVIIDRLVIAPAYQRKGIGTDVMQKIIADPSSRGKCLTLDVLKMNPARRLYERLGFILISEDEELAYYRRCASATTSKSFPRNLEI